MLINVVHNCWFDIFGQKPNISNSAEDFENIIINQVNSSTPVALCTAQGTDPTYKVDLLVERVNQKYEVIAMGSNEGIINAERAIQFASREGSWVVLQNLHLSPDWMEGIEKRLQSLQKHPDFRLFFTVPLVASVPITLLRVSRILTFERTAGIKSSMKQTLEGIPINRVGKSPVERARLYYLLSWVHGVMVERLNFIPLGWSKSYNFNDADFESGLFVIDKWIDDAGRNRSNVSPSAIPWKAFRDLLTKTIYAAKVDNSEDEARVLPIIDRAFNEAAYSVGYTLVEGEPLTAVTDGSDIDSFKQWISNLPEKESPKWLGLESDAEDAMIKIESKSENGGNGAGY